MSEPTQPPSPSIVNEHSCGATLEQHIVDIWAGMQVVGVGFGCREVYRALMELAEEVRHANSFETYLPQGGGLVPRTIKTAVQKAEAELKRRQAAKQAVNQSGEDDFVFPANLPKN